MALEKLRLVWDNNPDDVMVMSSGLFAPTINLYRKFMGETEDTDVKRAEHLQKNLRKDALELHDGSLGSNLPLLNVFFF